MLTAKSSELRSYWLLGGACLAVLLATARLAPAEEPPRPKEAPSRQLQYNRDIRPILADNCFACHGADSAGREADLRLDQREPAIEAGALAPGEVESSELVARILTDDPDLVMPPLETKKSLTDEQKQLLKEWVSAGAEYQPHWSFIPPTLPKPPVVQQESWPKNDLDRFVLAQLESAGLTPAPEAGAQTLFRRLHLDITGLPPSPEDVAQFAEDYDQRGDAALSEWIDRLMKNTAWGEHRARYWLDAARYGDTHGLHFDNYREMWIYRDWVIRTFNQNRPFDQFTIEQLAGDLLPNPTEDQLIATGFQRCNITTNEGGTIDEENLANYAADRVQTFGWVYLGLTTNCGQCHDHKFDPFTMRDYYSLAAYFRNTTQPAKDGNVKDGRGPMLIVPSDEDRPRWQVLPEEIASAKQRQAARKKDAQADFETWLTSTNAESLAKEIPLEQLVLHVPLTEGDNENVTAFFPSDCCTASPEETTSEEQVAPEKESTEKSTEEAAVEQDGECIADEAARETSNTECTCRKSTIQPTGELKWLEDGPAGPAPVFTPGNTFELGQAGDFERDQPFSYGAWVKTAGNAQAAIIARMDESASHRGWDLWQNGRAFAAHFIDSWPNNGLKVATRKQVVKPNKWQHVLVTYDGSGKPEGVKIFVDGKEEAVKVEKNTLESEASIRTSTPLRVGQRSQGAVFKDGAVQDVRIYERQLSADEILAIAGNAALQGLLKTDAKKRTEQQQKQLLEHYLTRYDAEFPNLTKAVEELETEKETIRGRSPVTHIQTERTDSSAMAHILMRGAYDKPGDEVQAATPAALHPLPSGAPADRMGLARWVVDPANPLTARVTVNRFWQEIFGRGIVATPEDFGVMGVPPTHPELLDWLAVDFQSNGWDVKRLFKQIFMSATYRQAAVVTPDKVEKDRDNVWLSRGPRFRMDAEMVRDCALASSGLLSSKMYGPGVKPYQPGGIWDIVGLPGGNTRNYVQDKGEDLYRRTVYTFWKRMSPPPNLEAFNAPSREVCTVRRERTNTPLQALVTLNDPQFVEAARHLAQSALLEVGEDFQGRLQFVTQRLLGRDFQKEERRVVQTSLEALTDYYASHVDDAKQLVSVGESSPSDQVDVATLAAWTMIVNQLMNLDETLNK